MTNTTLTPQVDVRRASERSATRLGWLDSKHSFSFSRHYDPANTHHGLLLVNNDDIVKPGTGFETHPHRDMEIVTWVLHPPQAGNEVSQVQPEVPAEFEKAVLAACRSCPEGAITAS